MQLHIHPDQKIIIRDSNGNVIYIDTVDNFILDYGSDPELLPNSRWNERLYIPDVMDRLADNFTQETSNQSWPDGDAILAAIEDIFAAKEVRNTPPEPE
jgi:hypothetical protein